MISCNAIPRMILRRVRPSSDSLQLKHSHSFRFDVPPSEVVPKDLDEAFVCILDLSGAAYVEVKYQTL